jgi:hypothetical protein
MKKLLILFFVLLILISNIVYSGNFSVFYGNREIKTGDSICLSGDSEYNLHLYVKNNTNDTISVKVIKSANSSSENTSNLMCFGPTCWPGDVTGCVDIPPLAIDSSFNADAYGTDNAHLFVTYKFINCDKPDDTLSTIVDYWIETVGVLDFSNSGIIIYPNPAKEFMYFDLSCINGQKSNIDIFDNLGRKVITQPVNNISVLVDLSHLPSGFYYFKISNNNLSGKIIKR